MSDDLQIVDAHQHFWDPAGDRYPWLSTRPLPSFRYGDYAALRRRYVPDDFRRDTAGHRVVATVHMEAEWDPADEVGETRWLAGLRQAHGLPTVAVAHARFESPEVDAVLAGHAALDFVRGIRQKPAAAEAPAAGRRGAPGSMDDPAWRRGYARLERHGLHFDVQTPWWHLDAAADLARDFPRISIVINHTALPADRSAAALAAWRRALETAAARPNVAIKISGLGRPDKSWPVEGNRQIVRDTIAIFGAARCMFASNFPVDGLCIGYRALFDAFKAFVADRPEAERRALFHGNAARIYRIAGI
ncbi:MAG TPA: amidohydrolase family protein [Candidatus Binatia bacterium]|nr:amidohydrolase family protein [Candidatus Binatia bacterium]